MFYKKCLLKLTEIKWNIDSNPNCSGPQVARHVILCASQSTNTQQHTLDVMQILCSQRYAGFATNVSSDKGFTCAVNYLLIIRQFYLIACNKVLPEKLPVSQLVSNSHGLYNTKIQYRGTCWLNLCIRKLNPSLCAGPPAGSTCVQNSTTGSANMALEQNQQAVWRVTGFW